MHSDTWISDLMHDLAPLLADYMMLWVLVDATAFNPKDPAEDEICWNISSNGVYWAKTTYDMQFKGSLVSSFPARVWNVWAPSCCMVFIWLMLQNRIWTIGRLLHREWMNEYFCSLCIWNLETAEHMFMECLVLGWSQGLVKWPSHKGLNRPLIWSWLGVHLPNSYWLGPSHHTYKKGTHLLIMGLTERLKRLWSDYPKVCQSRHNMLVVEAQVNWHRPHRRSSTVGAHGGQGGDATMPVSRRHGDFSDPLEWIIN
jgi:hypothetical protein